MFRSRHSDSWMAQGKNDGQRHTYDFSSCFFPKFKESAKGRFSREMTYFFDSYGPKIGGGGSSYPAFVQKYQKP